MLEECMVSSNVLSVLVLLVRCVCICLVIWVCLVMVLLCWVYGDLVLLDICMWLIVLRVSFGWVF